MKPTEGTTVIGKSVTIRGEITGSEELYIDGRIDGKITLSESRLTIGPNAKVRAELHVQDVVVFGSQEGAIFSTGKVELRQSAQVLGDITAARLSIEENASVRGKVMLAAKDSVTGREGQS